MKQGWRPPQELRCAARELARRESKDIVLVISRELPPWGELAAAGARLGAIVARRINHLYWLRQGLLSATAQAASHPADPAAGGQVVFAVPGFAVISADNGPPSP